jgi:hypothetical protein
VSASFRSRPRNGSCDHVAGCTTGSLTSTSWARGRARACRLPLDVLPARRVRHFGPQALAHVDQLGELPARSERRSGRVRRRRPGRPGGERWEERGEDVELGDSRRSPRRGRVLEVGANAWPNVFGPCVPTALRAVARSRFLSVGTRAERGLCQPRRATQDRRAGDVHLPRVPGTNDGGDPVDVVPRRVRADDRGPSPRAA